jgi:hypothetical protein
MNAHLDELVADVEIAVARRHKLQAGLLEVVTDLEATMDTSPPLSAQAEFAKLSRLLETASKVHRSMKAAQRRCNRAADLLLHEMGKA